MTRTSRHHYSRCRRGAAYIAALVLMTAFSTLAVAMVCTTGTSVRQADNSRGALGARLAAESGLEFMINCLSRARLPGDTTPETFLNDLTASLGQVLNGTANLQGMVVTKSSNSVFVPEIRTDGGSFCCWLTHGGDQKCRVFIKGWDGDMVRRLTIDFVFVQRQPAVFDYGLASRGPITISGSARIIGVNYPTEANVLSATESHVNAISVDGTSVEISGDLFTSGEGTQVSISGSPTIGGTKDPDEITSHVHLGVDAPDFPAVDTAPLVGLAVNVIDSATDIGAKTTFNNIRIAAGTNPVFTNKVVLNGIVYIESPNRVKFEGGVTMNGFVVTEENDTPLEDCQLHFAGHVEALGVEALPDTPEFADVKTKTGTFVLAPGFGVTFAGSFSAINGSIAADQLTFTGTAEGTVKGSVIGLEDMPTTVSGNVDIFVDRSNANPDPAGFVKSFALEPVPDSYTECTGEYPYE